MAAKITEAKDLEYHIEAERKADDELDRKGKKIENIFGEQLTGYLFLLNQVVPPFTTFDRKAAHHIAGSSNGRYMEDSVKFALAYLAVKYIGYIGLASTIAAFALKK